MKNHLVGLGPAAIEGLKAKVAKFDYSILGHQISVNAYNIVDRCEVCHVGIREPLDLRPADLAPDGPGKSLMRWLVLLLAIPTAKFSQFITRINSDVQVVTGATVALRRAMIKGHGNNKFWMWPMFEKENTEAGCQQCHAKDRVTDGADTLNLGRDMFSQRGCMGCHRYEGFDRETDALNNTRQNIGQLEDQITANEKMMRYAENPGSEVSDVEANALLAKASSLRVTNSLLAARIDQLNVQSKYLMQDVKKVGPNLKDVRLKLRKEWIPVWLQNPQAFRPETKMPTFWRFAAGNGSTRGTSARQGWRRSDSGHRGISLARQLQRKSSRAATR